MTEFETVKLCLVIYVNVCGVRVVAAALRARARQCYDRVRVEDTRWKRWFDYNANSEPARSCEFRLTFHFSSAFSTLPNFTINC